MTLQAKEMTAKIVRHQDLVVSPWPNGQGVTRDVAGKWLPDGRLEWLISLAELTADADFSLFDRCDRYFTLVSGEGVELTIGGASPFQCTPLVPFFFAGDVPTRCRAPRPAQAFNVFMARDETAIEVTVHAIAPGHRLGVSRKIIAAHCVFGEMVLEGHVLKPGDTITGSDAREIEAGNTGANLLLVQTA